MLWCPQCGYAYRDGFAVCSDCGRELLAEDMLPDGFFRDLPNGMGEADGREDYAFLMNVPTLQDFMFFHSQMEAYGIPYRRRESEVLDLLNVFRGYPAGGYDIFVPGDRLDDATILLSGEGEFEVPKSDSSELSGALVMLTEETDDFFAGIIMTKLKELGIPSAKKAVGYEYPPGGVCYRVLVGEEHYEAAMKCYEELICGREAPA